MITYSPYVRDAAKYRFAEIRKIVLLILLSDSQEPFEKFWTDISEMEGMIQSLVSESVIRRCLASLKEEGLVIEGERAGTAPPVFQITPTGYDRAREILVDMARLPRPPKPQ